MQVRHERVVSIGRFPLDDLASLGQVIVDNALVAVPKYKLLLLIGRLRYDAGEVDARADLERHVGRALNIHLGLFGGTERVCFVCGRGGDREQRGYYRGRKSAAGCAGRLTNWLTNWLANWAGQRTLRRASLPTTLSW